MPFISTTESYVPRRKSISDWHWHKHRAQVTLSSNPSRQRMYPLVATDRRSTVRRTDWPRHLLDMERPITVWLISRLWPRYPSRVGCVNFSPRRENDPRDECLGHLRSRIAHFSVGTNFFIHDKLLGENMSKVPFERVTFELSSKGATSFDIAKIFALRSRESS